MAQAVEVRDTWFISRSTFLYFTYVGIPILKKRAKMGVHAAVFGVFGKQYNIGIIH